MGRVARASAPFIEQVFVRRCAHISEIQLEYLDFSEEKLRTQGARSMDCGVPFCHSSCPVHNNIPDMNDSAYRSRFSDAINIIHSTNNFPEFTGRLCPGLCEAGCVASMNDEAIIIRFIEKTVAERAWKDGLIKPRPPLQRTGKKVAIVGSGPAGLSSAQQLNRAGHSVTVFEKNERIGGLLRFGIPDYKLEKNVIDRRLEQLVGEGVTFRACTHVGVDTKTDEIQKEFDAIILACGAEQPRNLLVPGRELKGIHFALDFLIQQNRRNAGLAVRSGEEITATGKRVLVIGGGDTGADCVGTAHRQNAASVHQLEINPQPPLSRSSNPPWPWWPLLLRVDSSHEEGGTRLWGVATTGFTGDAKGRVAAAHIRRVGEPPEWKPVPASEFRLETELVPIAMGFAGPASNGLVEQMGIKLDAKGNVPTDENGMTSVPKVFAAGDMRKGQSLVIWAMAEGRKVAQAVDRYLMGEHAVLSPHADSAPLG